MKKFLTQLFFFLAITIGLIAITTVALELYIAKKARFKCRPDAEYIVLGNSHPEQAYNDSLIDHFQNIGQAAETYLYTYIKTKEIIDQNKQIKTVFIEYSNTDLLSAWNKYIWGSGVMFWRYPLYSPFMSIKEKSVLAVNNFSGLNSSLSFSLKENMIRIVHHDLDYSKAIGGFLYNEREKVDSLLAHSNIQEEFQSLKKHQDEISTYNVTCLSNLVAYLKANNKRVILVRSPLHKAYSGLANEEVYEKILHTQFADVEYLDFGSLPLANSDFVDLEHLNFRGARKFSIWFNQLLKEGLLDKENKQEFINEKMKEMGDRSELRNGGRI
jgi:hypothetical protein